MIDVDRTAGRRKRALCAVTPLAKTTTRADFHDLLRIGDIQFVSVDKLSGITQFTAQSDGISASRGGMSYSGFRYCLG
jgi:hypothetical protein